MIVFASPYQKRSWQVKRNEVQGYFLIFANQFLELFFTDPLFVFRIQFFYNHQCAFNAIMHELRHFKSDSDDFLRAYLLLILAGINRRYCNEYNLSAERRKNHEAYQFKKLVEARIRELQRVEDYARELKISRITLNKIVKAQFGITATQFIKQRLLTEIKRELLFTSKTIAEITFDLCFSESSSLVRFFSKMEATSPSDFRSAYQNVNHFIKRV